MRSRVEISRERFNRIICSKKLREVLTAYFNAPAETTLNNLISEHEDMFKYWAHESDISYENLIKLCGAYYNESVDFSITDRKIMTGYKDSYGSWVCLSNKAIYIMWDIV